MFGTVSGTCPGGFFISWRLTFGPWDPVDGVAAGRTDEAELLSDDGFQFRNRMDIRWTWLVEDNNKLFTTDDNPW